MASLSSLPSFFYRNSAAGFMLGLLLIPSASFAQSTSNQSTLTNSAAPSASSVTTGGTNINYQTNNAYNNELGFGPGIFCRTPTLYVGANTGQARLSAYDPIQESGNATQNISGNIGLLYPFGSSALEDCKSFVRTIARDREISSQLSMIKACHELYQKGISVDARIYPLLASCEAYSKSKSEEQAKKASQQNKNSAPKPDPVRLIPKTKRVL